MKSPEETGFQILTASLLLALSVCAYAEQPAIGTTSCQVARGLQVARLSGLQFIDVRSPGEFEREHIAGASNVPLSELTKRGLPETGTLVIYCGEPSCPLSRNAAATLGSLGYGNLRLLQGGLAAWKQLGYPVEPQTPAQRVSLMLPEEVMRIVGRAEVSIIDVRPKHEFSSGHLPGALNVPLETLSDAKFPVAGEHVVYDRIQSRSHKAALLIAARGSVVKELAGGISTWAAKGYAVEVEGEPR